MCKHTLFQYHSADKVRRADFFPFPSGSRTYKYNLLPYEMIVKARAGKPEAVNTVIQTYIGYIKYLSYFQGSINDDIQDYLKASLMEALPKLRFDR